MNIFWVSIKKKKPCLCLHDSLQNSQRESGAIRHELRNKIFKGIFTLFSESFNSPTTNTACTHFDSKIKSKTFHFSLSLWRSSLGELVDYSSALSLSVFLSSVTLSVSVSLFHLCFLMLWLWKWWGEATNDRKDSQCWCIIDPRLPSGWKVKVSVGGVTQTIRTDAKPHKYTSA